MLSQMSNLRDVPKPVQAAGLVAGGSGITAALILIDPKYAIALVIGLGVAAAALLLYHRILKWQSRRRSAPMEEGVLRSDAPQLRRAEEKVKIDNLRRRFEEGIGKFREAGKNLYSLPWFMIVGEPGSGKTEAVRHCNVGFPPGLQDEYQGVGGTINMNWWFTNHGVIIDTAGRLMFEDVETGGTKEWREFLNLLKKYRPYCPINGVFLVIPADSLVKDTAEQIQQKASKIAQQFNVIQRTLAVRFPVFVVVTKCDLVMGFREFFDGLSHPELQHQIFGWSNPAAIDQPYSRDFVRQHLQTVKDRLRRRRLSLLLELAGDDTAAQESASVNALYSFPGSLAQLAPRMARYLDLIFGAGGEWGAKPVFFRGIYFTSSMQEGDALDEDLAQALGISVESLPGGSAWTRDRAYFLRDLFIKKVFPEKGLVTTAVNATKHYVRRRMTFWLSVAVAVLFLLIYTIHAALRFDDTVEHVTKYVAKAAKAKTDHSLDMVEFQGNDPILWNEEAGVPATNEKPVRRYQFYSAFKEMVDNWEKQRSGKWLFLPLRKLFNIDTKQLRLARKNVFEYSAVRSFYEQTSKLIASEPTDSNESWAVDSNELKVLAQLIRVRAGTGDPNLFFDPFYSYWRHRIGGAAEEENDTDVPTELNAVLGGLLVSNPNILKSLSAHSQAEEGINFAVGRFVKHWDPAKLMGQDSDINGLNNVIAALKDFNDKEKALLELKTLERIQAQWTVRFNELKVAYDAVEKYVATQKGSLQSRYKDWIKRMSADANASCDKLLIALQEGLKVPLADWRSEVEGVKKRWQDGSHAIGTIASDITALDPNFWAEVKGQRLYQIRFQMYNATNGKVNYKPDTNVSIHLEPAKKRVKEALDKVDNDFDPNSQIVSNNFNLAPKAYRFEDANKICADVLDSEKQNSKKQIVLAALSTVPTVKTLKDNIGSNTKTAITYLKEWASLKSYVDPDAYNRKSEEVYKKYVREYWLGTYLSDRIKNMIPEEPNWPIQYSRIGSLQYTNVLDSRGGVREQLADLGKPVGEIVSMIFEDGSTDPNVRNFRSNLSIVVGADGEKDWYKDVTKNWRALGKDPTTARDKLLKETPGTFITNYFPGVTRGIRREPPSERFVYLYWWRFSLETLKALTKKQEVPMPPDVRELLQYAERYPINANSKTDLTKSEFDDAEKKWASIKQGPSYKADTIGGGTRTGIPQIINDLLDDFESSLASDEIKNIGKRIDLVSAANAKAEREYLQLSLPVMGNEVIDDKLHYVKAEGINAESNGQHKITRDTEVLLATIPWSETKMTISFYIAQSDSPVPYVFYNSPWTFVRILDDAQMIDSTLNKSKIKKDVIYEGQKYPFTLVISWVSGASPSDILRP